MNAVSKVAGKFVVGLLKSFGIPIVLMVGMLSLATKKFPPPIKEYWKGLEALQNGPQLQDSMKSIANLQKQQALALEAIDGNTRGLAATVQEPNVEVEKKIKSLEYEVAYFKAKFARSEWEKHQLEKQLTRQTPTANNNSK